MVNHNCLGFSEEGPALRERRFAFLGLKFYNYTTAEAINIIEQYIHTRRPHRLSTITAELAVRASQERSLRDFYNSSDLLTVDSYVVYYAAKFLGKPIKEPVNATRLFFEFLKIAETARYRLYLLGASEGVINKTVTMLKSRFPLINIVGWHNGYFDFNSDGKIVEEIKHSRPDVLFIAMSSPLKENFMAKYFANLGVPLFFPVGGCFDVIAGKCRLAPLWMSRLGLEWFYRFIQEPKRLWKRYLVINTKFFFLWLKEFVTNLLRTI